MHHKYLENGKIRGMSHGYVDKLRQFGVSTRATANVHTEPSRNRGAIVNPSNLSIGSQEKGFAIPLINEVYIRTKSNFLV